MYAIVLFILLADTYFLIEFEFDFVRSCRPRGQRLDIDMLDVVVLCYIVEVEYYGLVIRRHRVTIVDIIVVAHGLAAVFLREGDGIPIGAVWIIVCLVQGHSHRECFVALALLQRYVEHFSEQKRLLDIE